MEFLILGPLEVRADGDAVALPGAKPRAVLAVLLLQANRPVSAERLALALWGEDAPAGAANTVQVHVSRLRKALPRADALLTTAAGYELRVDGDQLDAHRFERLAAQGREELAGGRAAEAAAALEAALALWRGRPLADLAFEAFAQREIARLDELRAAAQEDLVEARLALGRHADVLGDLERLIGEHPYRERLRGQLMLALYQSDRQADALRAYQDARAALVDGLGIEPGARLRELEQAILAQDPALGAVAPPGDAEPPAPARRLVSVLSAGLADADPEVMAGHAGACEAAIERHGGTAEAAGDAVVGVFGQREIREDDALRAGRAALEIRDAVPGIAIGADAGEVFVGDRGATGATFEAAARLRHAASGGEIRIGDTLRRLLAGSPEARRLGIEAPPEHPFVGRERELDALSEAFERCLRDGCTAVTVSGPAGIGKSRLARELAVRLSEQAAVVVGRCPAYGDSVAYRPLAEIVDQLGAPLEPAVLAAVGRSEGTSQPGEISWAFRRLFEHAAEERPLAVVVEDIHWAESTLLDLLEYLVAFGHGPPILLICLTRPELLETRPPYGTLLELAPLGDGEARRLIAPLAPGEAERIVETAEGNPLFLEQLAAVTAEGEVLPTTIQAVLAARIDRLPRRERTVLEHASVQGRTFYAGVLEEQDPAVLVSLVRRELIRGERSAVAGEDAFRFAHQLIREAAYRGLPRRRCAELHERLARRLDEDETVGHHLAEAHRHRAALGEADPALAAEAAERLSAAADAALTRGDPAAGARLLERAAGLAPDDQLLPRLGAALFEAGRVGDAARVLDDAIERAADPLRAQVERELVRLEEDPDAAADVPGADDARAWLLRGQLAFHAGRVAEADAAWRESELRGERRERFEVAGWRALGAVLGPMPVEEAIRLCEGLRDQVAESPLATALTLNPLALARAMAGDFGAASALVAQAAEALRELGAPVVSHLEASVWQLAGRPDRAEASLREDLEAPMSGARATTRVLLARVLLELDRADEAAELCRATAPGDAVTRAIWLGVRARIEREAPLAREAVALLEPTDLLSARGDAMLDLAHALRGEESARAARAGLALYERKGNLAAAARARSLLTHGEGAG